jgi:hypothetical protein
MQTRTNALGEPAGRAIAATDFTFDQSMSLDREVASQNSGPTTSERVCVVTFVRQPEPVT